MLKLNFWFVVISLLMLHGPVLSQTPDGEPSSGVESALQKTAKSGGFQHVLMSLVLPGAGEWALGQKGLAKVFIGADMSLWLGYFGIQQYAGVLQGDLESYAAVHAGVQSGASKDGQYWIDIGTAADIYQYNADRLLERNTAGRYAENPDFAWVWDSEANRITYIERRLHRLDWKRRATWLTGGLILNRLVSAIDVVRLIRRQSPQSNVDKQSHLYLDLKRDSADQVLPALNLLFKL